MKNILLILIDEYKDNWTGTILHIVSWLGIMILITLIL